MSNNTLEKYFTVIVFGILSCLIAPQFWQESSFLDSLTYSAMAKNYANGLGSFWQGYYHVLDTKFVSHPQLAIVLQGWFMKIFGTSFLVDKLYALLLILVQMFLIKAIWNLYYNRNSWWPMLLYITIPLVFWSATNIVLESTMIVFLLASLYTYLRYRINGKYLLVTISAFCITLAFLCKGPVCLFIWTIPFYYYIFIERKSFTKFILETGGIAFLSVFPLVLFYFFSTDARNFFHAYYEVQIVHSITKVKSVDNRFFILGAFISDILPLICISLLSFFYLKRRKITLQFGDMALASFLFAIALSAIVPFVLIYKQTKMYCITAMPFVAMAAAILSYPIIKKWVSNIERKQFQKLSNLAVSILILGIVLLFALRNTSTRDAELLSNCRNIGQKIPANSVIRVTNSIYEEYRYQAYLARFYNIGLQPWNINLPSHFAMIDTSFKDSMRQDYVEIPLNLAGHKFYKDTTN